MKKVWTLLSYGIKHKGSPILCWKYKGKSAGSDKTELDSSAACVPGQATSPAKGTGGTHILSVDDGDPLKL